MKKPIILSVAVLFAAFLFLENNTSTVDVTNDFLLENVRALAYGGDGDGEIDPDPTDPDIPPQPTTLMCFDNFDYKAPAPYPFRMCYDGGSQRAPNSACVNEFSYYFPTTSKTCLVLGPIVDPQ